MEADMKVILTPIRNPIGKPGRHPDANHEANLTLIWKPSRCSPGIIHVTHIEAFRKPTWKPSRSLPGDHMKAFWDHPNTFVDDLKTVGDHRKTFVDHSKTGEDHPNMFGDNQKTLRTAGKHVFDI